MTAPTCLYAFSGLNEAQHRLLKAEAHIEAAELELFYASHATELLTPDQLKALTEHRHRLGLAAGFCKLNGWPGGTP